MKTWFFFAQRSPFFIKISRVLCQFYYVRISMNTIHSLNTKNMKSKKKCCFFSCRIENLTSKCNTHCNDSFLREVNMFAQMACFSIDSVRKSSFHLVLIKLSAYSGSKLYFLWRSQLALQSKFFFIVTFLHFSFHVVSWSDVDNEIISRIMNYWSYITVAFYIYKKKTKLDWNRNMEQIGQVRLCKLKIDTVKNSNQTDVN